MQDQSYDHPDVAMHLFHPRSGRRLPAVTARIQRELPGPDGTKVGVVWSQPRPGAPTLLVFHGNGENVSDQLYTWPEWALRAGLNSCFVDYPGYSLSSGRPSLGRCRVATASALGFLLRHTRARVPGVILYGRSVGSLFAIDAAARSRSPRVIGLVIESGLANPRGWVTRRTPDATRERLGEEMIAAVERDFDHRRKLARARCPVMVLHTRHDQLVPVDNAERLARWAGPRLFKLKIFERGDHNSIHLANRHEIPTLLGDFTRAIGARPG